MERLTERNPNWINDETWERACEPDTEEMDDVYHKLKEYEDLEEQGLLIRLPCKVGQDVFTIISQRDNFSDQPYKIVSCISFRLELINKIGKTVFLTKEEAEKALERMG